MDWDQAQLAIKSKVTVGTDVNSPDSTYRIVNAVNDSVVVVQIGETNELKIPWIMLEKCFPQLNGPKGYEGRFFRRHFPSHKPCHVHVVGQIFVAAGLARLDGKCYRTCKFLES